MNANTITLAHQNTTAAGNHEFASPDMESGQAVCTSYFDSALFEQAPAYIKLALEPEESVKTLELDSVSGSGSGNYGIYQTPKGILKGVYISRDALGVDSDADSEDFPQEIPMALQPADEGDWEEQREADDDSEERAAEAEELLASADESEFVFDQNDSDEAAPADD